MANVSFTALQYKAQDIVNDFISLGADAIINGIATENLEGQMIVTITLKNIEKSDARKLKRRALMKPYFTHKVIW